MGPISQPRNMNFAANKLRKLSGRLIFTVLVTYRVAHGVLHNSIRLTPTLLNKKELSEFTYFCCWQILLQKSKIE